MAEQSKRSQMQKENSCESCADIDEAGIRIAAAKEKAIRRMDEEEVRGEYWEEIQNQD